GAVELCAVELRLPPSEGALEPHARGVQRHPALAVADAAERLLQLALATEVADARVVERGARGRGRDRALSLALEGLDVHGGDCNGSFCHHSPPFSVQGSTSLLPRLVEGSAAARALAPVPGEPGRDKGEGRARVHRVG